MNKHIKTQAMAVLNFYHCGKKIPEGAVYIGRAMPHLGLEASPLANPIKVPRGSDDATRDNVLVQYRKHLAGLVKAGKVSVQYLAGLEGRDLVCFCKPRQCHGDVIEEAIQWAVNQTKKPASPRP